MIDENQTKNARFLLDELYANAEPNVGPGFAGALFYYLNPSRWGKTAGRATRRELWGVFVGYFAVSILVPGLAFIAVAPLVEVKTFVFWSYLALRLWNVVFFAMFTTVFIRRLHDVGISGRKAVAPVVLWLVGCFLMKIDNGVGVWLHNAATLKTLETLEICGWIAGLIGLFWGARYWGTAFRVPGWPWTNRYGAPRLNPTRKRSRK